MRLAVFSDIHGNVPALKTILKHIKNNKIDKIICLGDVIGLGPESNECLKIINKEDLIFIAGNHELYYTKGIDEGHIRNKNILKHNKWVHSTIKQKVNDDVLEYKITHKGKTLYFTHYFLRNKRYPYESTSLFDHKILCRKVLSRFNYDYIFYGHRHKDRLDEYKGHKFYGLDSSGCTKDDVTCYYLIEVKDDVSIEKIELKYDRKKFEKILNETEFPDKKHICEHFYGIKKSAKKF